MIKKKPAANVLPTNALKRKPEESNVDSSKSKEAKFDTTSKNEALETIKGNTKELNQQKESTTTSSKDE